MKAQFITAEEVQDIIGVSRSKAYQIIQALNRVNTSHQTEHLGRSE